MYIVGCGDARLVGHHVRMADSFWNTLFDPSYVFDREWKQRRDINALREQDRAIAEEAMGTAIAEASTRRQLHELSVTMGVLVKMLAEAGGIDIERLRERAEAELERQRANAPQMPDPWRAQPVAGSVPAAAGDPYRGPQSAAPTVTCPGCQRVVPERLTVITERGALCDVCSARGVR
jgi:hypothetical protein